MKKQFKVLVWFVSLVSMFGCQTNQKQNVFLGVSVAPSYEYYMTGRTDLLKGFVIHVDDAKNLMSPGLVFLASGIEQEKEAYLTINEVRYDIPPLAGGLQEMVKTEKKSQGKAQFYSVTSGDDIVGKFVIPLKKEELVEGINEVSFYMTPGTDGFEVLSAQIQPVSEEKPAVVSQTYHLLARGRPPLMKDFDFVSGYHGEKSWHENDIPDWARRGKVNFYRAGIDYNNLERMFELFEEAGINLVAVGIPRDKNSADYQRVLAFIDRCHEKDIHITAFNSLGGVGLREWIMDPGLESWISHDEYGAKRWRQRGKVFAADLANKNYREYELKYAALQIDTGVDELYYDYAIGGTGDVLEFLADVRAIAKQKGKQVSIYGNCKGNILVDEVCDLTKSEGTTEAGIWGGKWVHNIPQARFYYAVGNGVKPYRSKYEGADPGVANPGAYDVREGMKAGWKKPIAEASAFQSHFAIAEAGSKLRNSWIKKDNPLAMEIWKNISNYYRFLAENQDLYTEVYTVSKIAILAPPLIPSFEVSVKRESLYNALAEESVMYEIVLLHRLTDAAMLRKYRAVIIPNIPWFEEEQLAALQAYKKAGGKLLAIGSTADIQEIADMVAPAELFTDLNTAAGRKKLFKNLEMLAGEQIISLQGAPYIVANVVHKRETDRFIAHFVNYDKPAQNIRVSLNLNGFADKPIGAIQLVSPDDVPKDLKDVTLTDKSVSFTLPEIDVYNMVVVSSTP